jgi:UDP-glucose 4-epimerase
MTRCARLVAGQPQAPYTTAEINISIVVTTVKILITGAAGFIGSHIAEACIGAGHEVLTLDDLSSGRRENVPAGAAFAEVDIRDADAVERQVADFRPDAISHQAAQTSVVVSTREPLRDAEINILGSLNLLNACADVGVAHFVFASTGGAIYGEVPESERADIDRSPNPLSPYACSKFAVENYLAAYATCRGVRSTVLRYSNVYGPRQDPHGEAGVVAIFANRLIDDTPVRVFARRQEGDDGCVRDYIYVSDVVRANIAAIDGKIGEGTINVCTGVATSTLELAQTLRELSGSSAEIAFGPSRAGDVERSVLEPGRFAALGRPTDLREGLSRAVNWFRARREN